MSKDTQRYLKVKFENEELEEIIANNPIFNEWRMAYVEKVVPPTKEEVCKALSEYFEKTVYFFENRAFFVQRYKEKQSYIDYSINVYSNGKLRIFHPFPPHLVTLIGRFYEGLANE